METWVKIFPNMQEDKAVEFTVSICSTDDSPHGNEFMVEINGHVPFSDSVSELKRLARARAEAVLKFLAGSGQL
jgi:hypothetical protein